MRNIFSIILNLDQPFKDISIFVPGAFLFSRAKPFGQSLEKGNKGNCEIILNLDQWLALTDIFVRKSGRGHNEKYFCEIILNSDQWFGRCH